MNRPKPIKVWSEGELVRPMDFEGTRARVAAVRYDEARANYVCQLVELARGPGMPAVDPNHWYDQDELETP